VTPLNEQELTDRAERSEVIEEVVHQLKTPLAMLRMHWEEEINNPELPQEIKIKVARSVEVIARLSHLINNLSLLHRSDHPHSPFAFTPLHLDELITDIVDDMGILADEKFQELQIVDLAEIMITGDRERLYQLFFNLIDNAIKYTPEYGHIDIALSRRYKWATVEIRDTGDGIPAHEIQPIFRRFYRGADHRNRHVSGSGLGLPICKMIAEAHEGRIEVESEVGVGSTFRVSLPLSDDAC